MSDKISLIHLYKNKWLYSLESIDLSSFKTTNFTDMNSMFYYYNSLKSIDLSSFDTTNANNMKYMFSGCTSLKKEIIKVNKNEEKILESSIFNIF